MIVRGVCLLLLLPVVAYGADFIHAVGDRTYTVRTAKDCFDISGHAAGECVRHFFDETEKELATTLERIRYRLARDRELFDETQARWVSFKDAECEVRSVSARAYSEPEGQKRLFVHACAAELNSQRVQQLESIPLGCDSCLQ